MIKSHLEDRFFQVRLNDGCLSIHPIEADVLQSQCIRVGPSLDKLCMADLPCNENMVAATFVVYTATFAT